MVFTMVLMKTNSSEEIDDDQCDKGDAMYDCSVQVDMHDLSEKVRLTDLRNYEDRTT